MAEIGLAASIIAVIQLSQDVLTGAYNYGRSVKNAKSDMDKICQDLKDANNVFNKLQALYNNAQKAEIPLENWPTLKSFDAGKVDGPLNQCRGELGRLFDELKPYEKRVKAFFQPLASPMKKDKVMGAFDRLKSQKKLLEEALSIDQMGQIIMTGHLVVGISTVQTREEKAKIVGWLATTDPTTNQNAAQDRHDDYTGRWFTRGEAYRNWTKTPHSFLWLHGIPGAGKTVLCSEIIKHTEEHCAQNDGFSFAYFYFTFADDAKQRRDGFLRSILSQLVHQMQTLPDVVRVLYNRYQHGNPPTDALEHAIHTVIEQAGEVFIIADAIDECPQGPERDRLLASIYKIHKWANLNLHLLVTSRKIPDIEETLMSLSERGPLSPISITEEVEADIRLFVKNQLETRRLKEWPQDTKDRILQRLVNGAHGMFRWVFCQLESLQECLNVNQITATLRSLPETLDETYERILRNVKRKHRKYAVAAIHWLAFSLRPMTLAELAEAMIFDPQVELPINESDRISPQLILEIMANLVVLSDNLVNQTDNENENNEQYKRPDIQEMSIVFAHFSVQEYLVSERLPPSINLFRTAEIAGHCFIGESCIKYILNCGADKQKLNSEDDFKSFPLWGYACGQRTYETRNGWWRHARTLDALPRTTFNDKVVEFFNSGSAFLEWLRIFHDDEIDTDEIQDGIIGGPLYHASSLGLNTIVSELLEGGSDVNFSGGWLGNALQAASYMGHETIVKLLIENGADVNTLGGLYGSALQAASCSGNEAITKLLIEKGANVNTCGGKYGSALQAASCMGNEAITKLLIEKGADVNTQGGRFGNALQAASCMGDVAITKLLVGKGADVNALVGKYGSALQAASHVGNEAIVKVLIEKGADVNTRGGQYGSALQAASLMGREAIIKLLIKSGADVNACGGERGSSLQAASAMGNKAIVKLLIENGADINACGGDCGSALQAASLHGNEAIVKLLIEKGADINTRDGEYGSALQAASYEGHETIVKLLIKKGAEVNTCGGKYGGALQAASFQGYEAVVKLLIENGADINACGGEYGSALQAASFGGNEAIIKLLIDKGADVNTRGGEYGSALQAASFEENEAIIKLLIEKGADINTLGGYYGSALQAASCRGNEAIVKLLIEKGADVNAQGGQYANALGACLASSVWRDKVIATAILLIKSGARLNTLNEESLTELRNLAAKDGRLKTLLEEKGFDCSGS